MNTIIAIFIGVISALLTNALIKFFNDTIQPWYQGVVYRGIDINGFWEGYYTDPEIQNVVGGKICEEIFIEQKGHKVNGRMTIKLHPNGTKDNKELLFKGVFKDNILNFSYESANKTRFGSGSSVLKLIDDGRTFDGKAVVVSSLNGSFFINSIKWQRGK